MRNRLACIALALAASWSATARAEPAADGIAFFESKIRPVLEQRCLSCHGSEKHKAGLRLDSREGVLRGGESGPAVVPGKVEESVLIQAIRHETVEMPPSGKLADGIIDDFVEWVRRGAPDPRDRPSASAPSSSDWSGILAERRKWWSLQPVAESPLPTVQSESWSAQPVDRFLAAKLEDAGLRTGPPADRRILIRRLSFVLTGLPPAADEVEAFVRDDSPEAYSRLVDRLLGSPQFGECWARHWMDVVRFGETHGVEWNFEIGGAWHYRDYLIRAFNRDVPFDQLVREHVAGDLLPHPRLAPELGLNESAIGPAFLQFGAVGHDDCYEFPELALEIIDNQIDVATKAFQATTVSCARCHDHKIDAVSARDYYGLHGILNSSYFACRQIDMPDLGRDTIRRLDALQPRLRKTLAEIWQRDIEQLPDRMLSAARQQADAKNAADEEAAKAGKIEPAKKPAGKPADAWADEGHLWRQLAPRPEDQFAARWASLAAEADGERQKRRAGVQGIELPLTQPAADQSPDNQTTSSAPWQVEGPGLAAGPTESGFLQMATDGDGAIASVRGSGFYSDRYSQRSHGAWRLPLSRLTTDKSHISLLISGGGWAAHRLVPDNCGLTEKTRFLKGEGPQWVTFALKDGRNEPHRLLLEVVGKAFNPRFPNREGMTPEIERDPRSWFGVLRAVLHDGRTPVDDLDWLEPLLQGDAPANQRQLTERYQAVAAAALGRWARGMATDADAKWLDWLLRQGWLTNRCDSTAELQSLVDETRELERAIPTTRTIQGLADLDAGADSPVLLRGNPRTPGEPVSRGYLEVLSPASDGSSGPSAGRLALADRLADPSNPLTARVYVNRAWHWVFGAGIVRSTDDFGHVGERPSHPELLDYLAARFVKEGWSTKRLLRELVLTQAFRQASERRGAACEDRDPDNVLLHRYPLRRLDAEAIRDLLLTVAGRIDLRMYGPSIEPFRDEPSPSRRIFAGPLDGDGRRSVYTRMTLMQEPPLLTIFNLPNGKFPQGRRDVTNVPAQALALLNDPFVRAMAQQWAKRLVAQPAASSEARLDFMFHGALGRGMTDAERQRLLPAIDRLAELHQVVPDDCLTSEPLWSDVAHTLFNLKEFVYVR